MDKKYIEENEIEIKYLRNQLSDKELEEFEVYLMDNPKLIDRLELDEFLLDHHSKFQQVDRKLKWLNSLTNVLALISPAYRSLASVLIGVFIGVFLFQENEFSIDDVLELQITRSSLVDSDGPNVILPLNSTMSNSSGYVLLIVNLSILDKKEYRFKMFSQLSSTGVANGVATTNYKGQLIFPIATNILKHEKYVLELEPKYEDTPSENFIIQVVPELSFQMQVKLIQKAKFPNFYYSKKESVRALSILANGH